MMMMMMFVFTVCSLYVTDDDIQIYHILQYILPVKTGIKWT